MKVPETDLYVLPMEDPHDLSAFDRLLHSGDVRAHDVVAIVGKTEGTGLGADAERAAADRSLREILSKHLTIPVGEVEDHVSIILSGGSPGVITPHIAVFIQRWLPSSDLPSDGTGRLTVGRAASTSIEPEEIGRTGHVHKVAEAVREALASAGLSGPEEVHAVLVKGPALTEEKIQVVQARGAEPVSTDLSIGPDGAMCYSNDASALGVAIALDEVPIERVDDASIRRDFNLYSDVALTSAAGEKSHAEVLVLGNRDDALGSLRIGHHSMTNIVDIFAIDRALASAGFNVDQATPRRDLPVAYVLAKMIIPGEERLLGNRITLSSDPVGYHVAKAMGGFMVASMTGMTCAFVSGGEHDSHQGPPGGNPLATIVRVGPAEPHVGS